MILKLHVCIRDTSNVSVQIIRINLLFSMEPLQVMSNVFINLYIGKKIKVSHWGFSLMKNRKCVKMEACALTFERKALRVCLCLTAAATELKWLLPSVGETSMLTSLSHWVEKLYWQQQHSSTLSTHSQRINRHLPAFVSLSLCYRTYNRGFKKKTLARHSDAPLKPLQKQHLGVSTEECLVCYAHPWCI